MKLLDVKKFKKNGLLCQLCQLVSPSNQIMKELKGLRYTLNIKNIWQTIHKRKEFCKN